MQMPVPQVYINPMQYYNGQRPQFVPQAPVVFQGQTMPPQYTFTNPNQPSVPCKLVGNF